MRNDSIVKLKDEDLKRRSLDSVRSRSPCPIIADANRSRWHSNASSLFASFHAENYTSTDGYRRTSTKAVLRIRLVSARIAIIRRRRMLTNSIE